MGFTARLNDACNLRWRDIDFVSPIKTITYEPRKTGEAVTVAVHPALEDYLLSVAAPDNEEAFVFPSVAERKHVSLANNNVSEEVRMRLTGHTTRSVHQKYTHHDLEVFQAAIGMLPHVGNK